MKRILVAFGLVLFLTFSSLGFAAEQYVTDRLTADATIDNMPCRWYGVLVETDGTNAVTIVLYNNRGAASGQVIGKLIVPGSNYYGGITFPFGIICSAGIFADVTGTGAAYWVYHGPIE